MLEFSEHKYNIDNFWRKIENSIEIDVFYFYWEKNSFSTSGQVTPQPQCYYE